MNMKTRYNFIGSLSGAEIFQNQEIERHQETGLYLGEGIEIANANGYYLFLWGRVYHPDGQRLATPDSLWILQSYLKIGFDFFRQIDGDYTLIIVSANSFLAYRDRHGAGPQFFYNDQFFASHLFAFKSIKGFVPQPDLSALAQFLSMGYIPSPQTSLEGVNKLGAGCFLKIENGQRTEGNMYLFEQFKGNYNTLKLSEQDAIAEYERIHKASIKARVTGKNKVGLLMSGGYDSAGNISALRDMYQGDVQTISIGFKDNPWSELPLARFLSERYGSEHKDYEIDGSEIMELPNIIGFIGDPFQEGGLMVNYLAMKLIGDNKPDIILGGDGNDQLHGTAGKELALNYRLKKMGAAPLQNLLSHILATKAFDKDSVYFRMKFHNDKIYNILKSDNFGFSPFEAQKLLNSKLPITKPPYLNKLPKGVKSFDEFFMVHNYYGDIMQVINEVILFKASKMAALHNNQLTFPYMSTAMYNFLSTVPRELKFKGSIIDLSKGRGTSKYLHKAYLKPKLPDEITNRKKQGGFAPLPIFFQSNENRKLFQSIVAKSSITNELLNAEKVNTFLTGYDHLAEQPSYWFWYSQVKAFQYFNLIMLTVWWEMMFEGKEISNLNELL
jgi:asparagine synthase (glutamine-hydrolysing)